jgi:Fe-S-cluster containining protein
MDAVRLQEGLAELEQHDPERAERVRRRSRAAVHRLRASFPGDADTGILAERGEEFEEYANDEPCPVLDPETGRCDLYAARPMTCRVFGPPVRSEGGLGICELCFKGATTDQIAACELRADTDDLEAELLARAEAAMGKYGDTIVAFVLGR